VTNHWAGSAGTVRQNHRQGLGARRWWPILAPLALLVVLASLLLPAGRHQWALSLFRQPTGYTALSFNHPTALPALAGKNTLISVSFTVNNQEGRAVTYKYVLTETAAGVSSIVGESARTVAAGASWSVSTSVRMICRASPCHVEVSLPGHPETIDFLTTATVDHPRKSHA
jgi:hypothetical protein